MDYVSLIAVISKTVGVPAGLLLAICSHESFGLTNVFTENDKGTPSHGLCQVKSATAQLFGYSGSKEELMIPKKNILIAAKYLKFQLKRYNQSWCMATASYNAGSWHPSKKKLGKPMNWRYLEKVSKYLTPEEAEKLMDCGFPVSTEVAETN